MEPDYKTRELKKLVINLETLGIGTKAINYIESEFNDIQNKQKEKITSYNDIQIEKQEYYATQIKYFDKINNIYNSIDKIIDLINKLPITVLNNKNAESIKNIAGLINDKDNLLIYILKSNIDTASLINQLNLMISLSVESITEKALINSFLDNITFNNGVDMKDSTPKRP